MNEPKIEDYFVPVKSRYSVEEINEMRDLVAQVMYMEDDCPYAWPMPHYPEDYISRNLWEPRLQTYLMAGVPVSVMREFVERRKKEIDEKYE